MIRITKNHGQPPNRLTTQACRDKVLNCLQNPGGHRFDAYYYRDGCIDELHLLYNRKCGYCETSENAGGVLRVDHYRPKKKVTGLTNHSGYYWLSYEWSNLLLACETCNGRKSNKFPVASEANRIATPTFSEDGHCTTEYRSITSAVYIAEAATLLNPEIDSVEDHFIFQPTGEIVGLTPRANSTINVLSLNRQGLILSRKKMVDTFIIMIHDCVDHFIRTGNDSHIQLSLKGVFDKLVLLPDKENQYSRFGWFMFNKFDIFFSNRFGQKEGELVKTAFRKFLTNSL